MKLWHFGTLAPWHLIIKSTLVVPYLYDKCLAFFYKRAMRHCGKGVYLRPSSCDFKGLENLSVGDGTSIPKGSVIYCTEAPCTIGEKVVFGPRPTIITGDHAIDIVGKHIIDVTVEDKKKMIDTLAPDTLALDTLTLDTLTPGANVDTLTSGTLAPDTWHSGTPYDQPVVIEDGCWIGANVSILKGVTIGRGSVVAAGAVVTKSCEPYSIIGGVPAKVIKMRFSQEQIKEHEKLLYGK